MGIFFSKEEEEEEISTPHFEKYADLTTIINNDPRSPGEQEGIPRTPIIVQNQLADPRSPSHIMTRTPVFAIPEPVSPFVRYKMDNRGFQDSPLSTGVDKLAKVDESGLHDGNDEVDDESKSETTSKDLKDEEMDCEFALTQQFDSLGLEDEEIASAIDCSPVSSKDKSALIKNKEKKNRPKRGQSKTKNSLLKQALFKPYVDENQQESKPSFSSQPDSKRKPLNVKSNNMVFCNENFAKSAEKSTKLSSPSLKRKSKCTRRLPMGDALMDKENVSVH